MGLKIGVIADDFTGATDIAGFLVAGGASTALLTDLDAASEVAEDTGAVVIGLKTRSIPAAEAVAQSLAALKTLQRWGADQIIFKYCSTFDSTPAGNIGPVTDALLEALEQDFTVVVPSLPVNGRTVYHANLFVHGEPLAESSMRNHPVTPMTDSNLVRLMEGQSRGRATNVPFDTVERGADAIREALDEARKAGFSYVVVDAMTASHLDAIAVAVADLPLITGGSGIGGAVAAHHTERSDDPDPIDQWTATEAPAIVLSGSSSRATNEQVARYAAEAPHHSLDLERVLEDAEAYRSELLEWIQTSSTGASAPIVYATDAPERVLAAQQAYGAERLSGAIEGFLGRLATELAERGFRRFIIAGGETSGAVTRALGVRGFDIGPSIAPGVPWTRALGTDLELALKSGNFGGPDFFFAAQDLPAPAA